MNKELIKDKYHDAGHRPRNTDKRKRKISLSPEAAFEKIHHKFGWPKLVTKLERERDEVRETITRLNRRLTKAEGIITAAGLVENRPKSGGGSLGRALANYAAEQWKDIAERSIGYVYENDWDPEACDIVKDYEKLAGGPHPIHSR
jgi:hypothetical protein